MENNFINKPQSNKYKRIAWGAIILLAGSLLMAMNFDLISSNYRKIIISIPSIIFAIGVVNLFDKQRWKLGLFATVFGAILILGRVIGFLPLPGQVIWPTLLIIFGVVSLLKTARGKRFMQECKTRFKYRKQYVRYK